MKRYLCTSILFVSSLSFALTPVTINSASINYAAHTVTVVGSGFCTGALPAVTFNTTRLKVTSACSPSVIVASLPVQAAGSYRLVIANSEGASGTFAVTYGAVGPQGATGPAGPKGATGLTGAEGLQGVKGATGLTGATGSQGIAGPQGLTGATGATGAAGATGSTGPLGPAGPQGVPGPQGAQGLQGLAGPAGATGPQGVAGTNGNDGAAGPQGPQGLVGPQGSAGLAGPQGSAGAGLNWRGVWSSPTSYNVNDVVSFGGTSYVAVLAGTNQEPDLTSVPANDMAFVVNDAGVYTWTFVLPANPQGVVTPIAGTVPNGNQPIDQWCGTYPGAPVNEGFLIPNVSAYLQSSDVELGSGPVQLDLVFFQPSGTSIPAICIVPASGVGLISNLYGPQLWTGSLASPTFVAGPYTEPQSNGVPGSVTITPAANVYWNVIAQAGVAGANGVAGATGPQGFIGPQGLQGMAGATGPQGATGVIGAQGITGPQGLKGDTGATGPTGSDGAQGPQGLKGDTGAVGAQGPQGAQGPAGANGTGFTSRGTWNPATSYAVNDVVSFTPTVITYNVNLTFGAAGSAVGTIATDGTQGVLSPSNIVSWNLTLTDHGTNSTILTQANSVASEGAYNSGSAANNDFSATSTTLLFNYGMGDAGSWSIAGASGQLCFTSYSNCFGPSNAYGTWSINGDSQWTYSGAGGSQVVATGGATTHGGTSTYVATGPVAAGTVPGTLPWAMVAQAGTPGAPGTNGTNGTGGINGINGLSGAQGPQGLQGAASTVPGPQGPQGNPGTNGTNGLNGTPGASLGEMRAALLQWYPQTYPAGTNPAAIAFDGSNLWITNYTSNVVTKLRANDGVIVGTYPTGAWSVGIAFDGTNIWVVNSNSSTVTKLQASDGTLVGTYPVGASPSEAVFDGANIWVTNTWSNSVTELRATDGAVIGSYPTGANPKGITFDGNNIWVSNYGSNNMTELRASDGAVLGTFPLGTGPYGVAFDGLNVWAVNGGDNTVTKLRASDGALVGTYAVGHTPYFMAFDGSNIWVTNGADNTVTKLRASSGAFLGTYPVGLRPDMVAFDGSNVWVTNDGGGVTRIGATK